MCAYESMTMPESEKTSAQHACSGADDLYHTFVKKNLKLSILFQR